MSDTKHLWDYPEDMYNARCKKCNITRFKEKYLGRYSWVYYKDGSGIPIFKMPKCDKIGGNK